MEYGTHKNVHNYHMRNHIIISEKFSAILIGSAGWNAIINGLSVPRVPITCEIRGSNYLHSNFETWSYSPLCINIFVFSPSSHLCVLFSDRIEKHIHVAFEKTRYASLKKKHVAVWLQTRSVMSVSI
jgi:hypothetical protein